MKNSKFLIALLLLCISLPAAANVASAAINLKSITNNQSSATIIPIGIRNILYVSSYSNTFPTFPDQVSGLESVFGKYDNINVDYEFMYSKNYSNDPENIRLFSDLLEYRLRHSTYPIDLLMVADDDAFNFALDRRNTLFKGIPIVFLGVNDVEKACKFNHDPQITGVAEEVSIDKTVELMLKLFPNKGEFYVICDGTVTGQANLKRFYEYASAHPKLNYKLLDLRELSFEEFYSKLSKIPSDVPILMISPYQDKNKKIFPFGQALKQIVSSTNAPLFHLWAPGIGQGLFGGAAASHFDQGKSAAELAVKILNGTSPIKMTVINNNPSIYIFDYKQLKRFHISGKKLPKGSIVINSPASFYRANKSIILSVLGIFITMLLLIIMLVINMIKKRRYAKELIEETRLAQESDHLKSSFLANISHEIRTPLNAIVGFSNLVQDTSLTEEDRRTYGDLIQENARSLTDMIGDILMLSRLESGQIELHNSRFSINELMETIEQVMRERFRDKTNVRLITDYGAHYTIESDRDLLSRVISNLVNNAFKNTETGSITMKYYIDKEMLTVKIIDTGIGIPENFQKFIFKQFDKLNIKKYIKGAGVGLPVSKTIINLMGGEIKFISKEGEGSTFWFTIPCNPE